jgi:hypothetical protein
MRLHERSYRESAETISTSGCFLNQVVLDSTERVFQECGYPVLFEVHQDRPIVGTLLPCPLVSSRNTNRALFGKGKFKHATNERFGRGGHGKGGRESRPIGSIGGCTDRLKGLDQPIGHACIPTDQPWKRFGKNALGTGVRWAHPFTDHKVEPEPVSDTGQIGNRTSC